MILLILACTSIGWLCGAPVAGLIAGVALVLLSGTVV